MKKYNVPIPEGSAYDGNEHSETDTKEGHTNTLCVKVMSLAEDNGEDLECEIQDAQNQCRPQIKQERHAIQQNQFWKMIGQNESIPLLKRYLLNGT